MAQQNFICQVVKIRVDGQNPTSAVYLQLDLPKWGTTDYVSVDGVKLEVLTVALSAMLNKSNVNGLLDVPAGDGNSWNCYGMEIPA